MTFPSLNQEYCDTENRCTGVLPHTFYYNFCWDQEYCYTKDCYIKLGSTVVRPDFSYSLAYDNFFQRSNVGGQNKNKNKMSQNKDITWSNDKLSLQKCI